MCKPAKEREIPKNKDAEPALSTTLDPYDYASGSGKTYHNKNKPTKVEDESTKDKIPVPAGYDAPTETAGTTNVWKTNAGDSPETKVPKKKVEAKEEAADEKAEEKEATPAKEEKEEKAPAKA